MSSRILVASSFDGALLPYDVGTKHLRHLFLDVEDGHVLIDFVIAHEPIVHVNGRHRLLFALLRILSVGPLLGFCRHAARAPGPKREVGEVVLDNLLHRGLCRGPSRRWPPSFFILFFAHLTFLFSFLLYYLIKRIHLWSYGFR
jgi:hypothetical protein